MSLRLLLPDVRMASPCSSEPRSQASLPLNSRCAHGAGGSNLSDAAVYALLWGASIPATVTHDDCTQRSSAAC